MLPHPHWHTGLLLSCHNRIPSYVTVLDVESRCVLLQLTVSNMLLLLQAAGACCWPCSADSSYGTWAVGVCSFLGV
jgi:hypothetical protein